MLVAHLLPKSIDFLQKILNFGFEAFFQVIELHYICSLQLALIKKAEFLDNLIENFKKISFIVSTFFC